MRGRGVPVGVGVVVVVVVALGVVAVAVDRKVAGDGRPAPSARAVFDAAIVELAKAPVMRYTTSVAGGTLDVRTSGRGASLGTISVAGQRLRTMTVGGKTYAQLPDGAAGAGALKGRWVTGGAMAPTTPAALPVNLRSPVELARSLLAAFDERAVLPSGETVIADVPALGARTKLGTVWVSRDAPHRVLRVEFGAASSSGIPAPPKLPPLPPGVTLPPGVSLPPSFRAAPAAVMDLPQVSPEEVQQLFRELRKEAQQLTRAVDGSVQYDLQGGGAQVRCGVAGCSVTARVTGRTVTRDKDTKVVGGTVTAEMIASIQIDGQPAGSCTGTAVLPLTGSGALACTNPAAGAVYRAVDARKRAIAAAQSRVTRRPVPYTIAVTGQAQVVATARVQVQVLLRALELEARLADLIGRATDPGPGPAPTPPPTAAPSRAPSPVVVPSPSPSTPPDCTRSRPGGAVTSGAGWIQYTAGPGGRAGRGTACLEAPLDKRGTRPTVLPVGMAAAQRTAVAAGRPPGEVARCHIVGAQLGGANNRTDNLVPCWQSGVNVADTTNPQGMTGFENGAAARISGSPAETMRYVVDPQYKSGASTVPFGLTMFAATYSPSGAVTWVDYHQLGNDRVIGRRIVNLGN